jgi:hypothetical protein
MSNTPFAYAVCSVLHRSVEFKVESSRFNDQKYDEFRTNFSDSF